MSTGTQGSRTSWTCSERKVLIQSMGSMGFYRTGSSEDIAKMWEEVKGDLTRD